MWTGSELIVTGPLGFGRYHPASDTWLPMSSAGAPANGASQFAAWTGSEVLVIGDASASYNPGTDTWTPVSTINIPPASVLRDGAAVWTGTEMIVMGGSANTHARYTRSTGASRIWFSTTKRDACSSTPHSVVWCGGI